MYANQNYIHQPLLTLPACHCLLQSQLLLHLNPVAKKLFRILHSNLLQTNLLAHYNPLKSLSQQHPFLFSLQGLPFSVSLIKPFYTPSPVQDNDIQILSFHISNIIFPNLLMHTYLPDYNPPENNWDIYLRYYTLHYKQHSVNSSNTIL